MASPLHATPPPKPFAISTDRRGIKTPHPRVFSESPTRVTPPKPNVRHILTPPAASCLRVTSPPCDELPEVTNLEITTVEKANEVFEAAICLLDDAYLIPSKPRYQFVLRAQDLLYKVLNCNQTNLRLRSFCKLEMVRISPDPDFQRHWIKKGLEDFDTYSQTTCLRFKNRLTTADEVKDCIATYLNIRKKCSTDLPDLSEHAFKKYGECEKYLPQPDRLVEVQIAAQESPSVRTPETPHTDDESEAAMLETTSIAKADAVFQMALQYLEEAYSNTEEYKLDLILLAQDLLYKVLNHDDSDWQLSVLSKIEMTRVSSYPDFQEYWINKALKNLDAVFDKTCCTLELENRDLLIEEISSIYQRISKTFFRTFPELARHALQKNNKCQAYLNPQNTTAATPPMTPAASPARDELSAAPESPPKEHDSTASSAKAEPSASHQSPPKEHDTIVAVVVSPTPTTSDKTSTVNKTKAVFFFSLSVCVLVAIAQRGRLKQLVRNISNLTMIYIMHPERLRSLVKRLYVENRFIMTGQSGQH